MLAFEIWIDDERVCLAGIDDWAVLSAHITGTRHRRSAPAADGEIEFSIGALTEPDVTGVAHHARWKGRQLGVGTKVTICVVDTDRPDEPIRRYRSDRDVQESPFTDEEIDEFERADWLKAKFEPENGDP